MGVPDNVLRSAMRFSFSSHLNENDIEKQPRASSSQLTSYATKKCERSGPNSGVKESIINYCRTISYKRVFFLLEPHIFH